MGSTWAGIAGAKLFRRVPNRGDCAIDEKRIGWSHGYSLVAKCELYCFRQVYGPASC